MTLDGQPLTLSGAPSQFSPVQANRGRSERIDLVLGTLPPDSDGDGMSDAWEPQFFGAAGANPNDDPDGDGLSNLREYRAGTNPTDAQSRFELMEIAASPSGVQVRWTSQPNRKYRVRRSATLLAAPAAYQVIRSGIEATPACFALELLDECARAAGRGMFNHEDVEQVRRRCVFTTHTPVPAGHDQFPLDLVGRVLGRTDLFAIKSLF